MLAVRLFDTDVLDQKRAGEVGLHLDQGFGEKLREIVDERVDVKDPSLHLLDGEARRCDRFRPWTVDQIVPMGSHEFVPVRAIPSATCARNGPGGESQWPCAKSTPISRSAARPISPSTASPIVFLPITCPTSLIARTIARSTGSCATSLTKLPSILRKSTGKCLRYPKEDIPAPKSSSENKHPRDFSSPKTRAALSKLAIAAVSVSSKQMVPGRMT